MTTTRPFLYSSTSYNALEQQSLANIIGCGQQATNRISWSGGGYNNAVTSVRVSRLAINGISTPRFVYNSYYKNGTGEDALPNAVHYKLAVEYPIGTIIPVTFGGKQVGTMQPYGMLVSDPSGINIPPGATFYERTTTQPPMPPVAAVSGSTTGGALAAATYYYKVTSVTDGGESNASNEVSVTNTGTTSSNTITFADLNMSGVNVIKYNIYRGTSSNTEIFIASIPTGTRSFVDTGTNNTAPSTTITTTSTTTGPTVASTVGFAVGDTILVNGTTLLTIEQVTSGTQIIVNTSTAFTSGQTVTLANAPPSTTAVVWGTVVSNSVYDTNEGARNGLDLTYNAYGFSYIASLSNLPAANAILSSYAGQNAALNKPPIALIGDSIMNGTGYVSTAKPWRGFGNYALNDAFPYVNVSTGGETAASFATLLHSVKRMAMVQTCKYSVCEYGTNDLGGTLAALQANLITIAQRCINAGVKMHWQTTLIAKAGSTDGWQTYTNQTPSVSDSVRQPLNQWLRAPASAGAGNSFLYDVGSAYAPFIGIADTSLLMEKNANGTAITINPTTGAISNGSGGYWPVIYTGKLAQNVGTISGTSTTLTDSGATFTTNQWVACMIAKTTSGTTEYFEILSNTATVITINGTWASNPTSASTYYIYNGPTIDGTHPTDPIHQIMAGAIPVSSFV